MDWPCKWGKISFAWTEKRICFLVKKKESDPSLAGLKTGDNMFGPIRLILRILSIQLDMNRIKRPDPYFTFEVLMKRNHGSESRFLGWAAQKRIKETGGFIEGDRNFTGSELLSLCPSDKP